MAAFQTGDIAAFQTIHVTFDGHHAIAYPVDEQGRKEDIEFSHEATMLLINGIRKRYHELTSNNRARPQVYRELHEELTRHGYNFSLERIRRKWNNLLGTYKRVKKEFSPKKPPWEYYQVLSEFLPTDSSYPSSTGAFVKVTDGRSGGMVVESGDAMQESSGTRVTVHLPTSSVAKQVEQGSGRQALLNQYLQHLSDTQDFHHHYKKRKERRERLKLKALQKIGKELQIIAKTQCEILKKQDRILRAITSAME